MRLATVARSALLLLAPTLSLSSGPCAAGSVEVEVEGCGRAGSSRVALRGGGTVELTVRGPGLDRTRRASASGLGSRLDLSLRGRSGGSSPAVTLTAGIPAAVEDGDDGRIVLETEAGEESFPVRLVAPAVVESITVEDASATEGRFRLVPSRSYAVRVRGARLWDLAVARPPAGAHLSVGSRADHQLVLHLRVEPGASFRLSAADLASPKGCDGRLVVGSGEALVTAEGAVPRP